MLQWVIRRHKAARFGHVRSYLKKQTNEGAAGMSAVCQKPTYDHYRPPAPLTIAPTLDPVVSMN